MSASRKFRRHVMFLRGFGAFLLGFGLMYLAVIGVQSLIETPPANTVEIVTVYDG